MRQDQGVAPWWLDKLKTLLSCRTMYAGGYKPAIRRPFGGRKRQHTAQHNCDFTEVLISSRAEVAKWLQRCARHITGSPKQGYQWPHEKDLCPPNFFFKKSFFFSA